ncbi:EF-hand domain-containing protein [Paenochrobactrum pullorum]|uniref:EF-hand domain-containing protein n=1 Tax=Paenochrobactrum pullorum TaxID=1324351 RepID=UPI0035BC3E9D
MKAAPIYIALIASVVFSAPTFAQSNDAKSDDKTAVETINHHHKKRGPIDEATFMNMDELKAADTDKDGLLSRAEMEAHVQKMMIKRAADQMERRLDVNKDGKISLEAIEKHRAARFAELDKNKDGKIDRSEMKDGKKHFKRGHDGKRHGKHDEKKAD